jgi:S-DNA-T family DNA segregation ATPase FtsK/SpoIIIE
MLFLSGELSKPIRLQSAYISEEELHGVVDYLKSQGGPHDLDSIDLDNAGGTGGEAAFGSMGSDDDDLFDEARHAVVEAGKASTSYLQRKLRIGYSRAARLMDLLEERGVIGPQDGSKPRDIIGASDNDNTDEERF